MTINSLHPTCLSSLSANYNFQDIAVAYQIVYYCSCCIAQSTSTCFLIFQIIGFLLLTGNNSILHFCFDLSHTLLPYWSLHNHDHEQFCIHSLSMAIYFCNDEFHIRITLFRSFCDKHALVEPAF